MIDDVPLPGMPPDPPAGTSPPAGVHIQRYRPRSRLLCGDCMAQIHLLGATKAPYPSPVRWLFTVGSLTRHLCEEHKEQRVREHLR